MGDRQDEIILKPAEEKESIIGNTTLPIKKIAGPIPTNVQGNVAAAWNQKERPETTLL